MKRTFIFFTLTLICLSFFSCSDDKITSGSTTDSIIGTWYLYSVEGKEVNDCLKKSTMTFTNENVTISLYSEESDICEVAIVEEGQWHSKKEDIYNITLRGEESRTKTLTFKEDANTLSYYDTQSNIEYLYKKTTKDKEIKEDPIIGTWNIESRSVALNDCEKKSYIVYKKDGTCFMHYFYKNNDGTCREEILPQTWKNLGDNNYENYRKDGEVSKYVVKFIDEETMSFETSGKNTEVYKKKNSNSESDDTNPDNPNSTDTTDPIIGTWYIESRPVALNDCEKKTYITYKKDGTCIMYYFYKNADGTCSEMVSPLTWRNLGDNNYENYREDGAVSKYVVKFIDEETMSFETSGNYIEVFKRKNSNSESDDNNPNTTNPTDTTDPVIGKWYIESTTEDISDCMKKTYLVFSKDGNYTVYVYEVDDNGICNAVKIDSYWKSLGNNKYEITNISGSSVLHLKFMDNNKKMTFVDEDTTVNEITIFVKR